MQSKSSAYFMNEDEKAEYEEKIQARIGEVWSKIEAKQESLQKE